MNFDIDSIRLREVDFKIANDLNVEFNKRAAYAIRIDIDFLDNDPTQCRVTLKLTNVPDECPFTVEMLVSGYCKCKKKMSNDEITEFLKNDAAPILYPYARQYLQQLFVQSGLNVEYLPRVLAYAKIGWMVHAKEQSSGAGKGKQPKAGKAESSKP